MKKTRIGLIGSSALTLFGILLRLNAQAIAWPRTYNFSGLRADTVWAHTESAIGQVALVLMCIGGLLLVATYLHWLFAKDADTMNKDKTSV